MWLKSIHDFYAEMLWSFIEFVTGFSDQKSVPEKSGLKIPFLKSGPENRTEKS